METTSKLGEKEEGFAALFNEFVSKAQSSGDPKISDEPEAEYSGVERTTKKRDERKVENKGDAEVGGTETSVASASTSAQTTSKGSPSSGRTKEGAEPTLSDEVQKRKPKDNDETESSEEQVGKSRTSPSALHAQSSSPVPSSAGSSYQTSPSSSFSSSASITPASSPLTALQPRSSILSAASSRLAKSASKVPPKPEKPVLRDRAGRKRNNSLDSEFVTDFFTKRERSKSVGQPSKLKPEKEGPRYRNQKTKVPSRQPGDKRKLKPKVYRPGIDFVPGFKLEAMDFCQNKWYLAKIVQVDEEEQQVLIHFDKWNSRYDEWVDCDSERLRPLVRQSTRKEGVPQQHPTGDFKYGEEVLARWSDCRYYPAKVLSVNRNGSYRMLFYDGIEKNVLAANTRVMPDELKAQNFFSNFNLPATPPAKGKKRWFTKEATSSSTTTTPVTPQSAPAEVPPEPSSTSPTTSGTKRRHSGGVSSSPLTPPLAPPKKPKVEEKVKSPKEVKPPVKPKLETSPMSEDDLPISSLLPKSDTGLLQAVDSKPVLKPVLTPAKMEELISRNIKEPLLNDKDLGLLRDRPRKFLAPKELVIDLDHNKYKCDVKGCDKSFRKETLLEYHTKYYHATKTSTSSAASRVLSRTKKMMSGSHPSKMSPHKRLSAPADLVSSFQRNLGERGGQRKRLKSGGGMPRGQCQSPPPVRKRNRVRHRSEPVKARDDPVEREPPTKSNGSETEETSKGVQRVPLITYHQSKVEETAAVDKQVTGQKEVQSKVKSYHKEEEKALERVAEEAVRIPKATPSSSGTREGAPERTKERGFRSKDLKSVLAEVKLVEEDIRKEEEKQRHRRKHKKNKEKKRRKKKKKEKEKRRRLKSKGKMGIGEDDGTDEETDSDEEDEHVTMDQERGRTSEDSPVPETFKQPNSGKIVRRKNIFRSSLVGVDDEVVKCVCKNKEEEGFMIQCEFCNCWQHSTCVGLSSKSIPKKYMCYYCQISQDATPHYLDSEDYAWYERGYLPRMPDFGKGVRPEDKQAASLRLATNSLIADVLTIAELLQGVQQKIAILQNPDHPEARLWAHDWILRLQRKSDLAALAQSDSCYGSILGGILSLGKQQNQVTAHSQTNSAGGGVTASNSAMVKPAEHSIMSDVVSHGSNISEPLSKDVVQPPESNSRTGEQLESPSVSIPTSTVDRQGSDSAIPPLASASGSESSSSKVAMPSTSGLGVPDVEVKRGPELASQATEKGVADTAFREPAHAGEVAKSSKGAQEGDTTVGAIVSTDSKVSAAKGEAAIDTSQAVDGQVLTDEQKEVAGEARPAVSKRKDATVADRDSSSVPSSSESASKNSEMKDSTEKSPSGDQGQHPSRGDESTVASAIGQPLVMSSMESTSKDTSSTGGTGKVSSTSETNLGKTLPNVAQSSDSQEAGKQDSILSSVAGNSVQGPQTGVKPGQVSSVSPNSQNVSSTAPPSEVMIDAAPGLLSAGGNNVKPPIDVADCSKAPVDTPSCSGQGQQVALNVEDVIRRQIDHGGKEAKPPGESKDIPRDESKEPVAGVTLENATTEGGKEMKREASPSTVQLPGSSTSGRPAKGQAQGQEVTVELSQAYLLRHINMLHSQLSERLTLIEMEVEKLEKMFASTASGWNAVSEDPITTRKRLRLLLSDLKKISNIVSI